VITGLEAVFAEDKPPELIVLAEDLLQQARMERRSETHDNVSIADLANGLASRLGLTAEVSGFTDQIGLQVQFNESDLAFLRRLLLVYDGDMQIVGNALHVSPRADVQRGNVSLAMHSQLRSARILADLAHQVSGVTVSGWDDTNGSRIQVRGQGTNSGPGRGTKGQDIISRAIGTRNHHVHHVAVLNSDEAQALADTICDEHARRFVVLSGMADGNPDIRIGTHVEITDTGRFDNTYYITYARHFFSSDEEDASGYITEFEGQCSYWGGS
jgi:phage protein D